MSGLAHYLEDEAVATVVVALIREHAEQLRPPRALWVPYPLGRPFGVPNDATVQAGVLRQALALLGASCGPVLVDAQEPAGDVVEDVAWLCPVSFGAVAEGEIGLANRIEREMTALKPWYELGRERRGRTTVGLAPIPVDESAHWLARYVEDPEQREAFAETNEIDALRWSAGDLKSFYLEAATSQPGTSPAIQVEEWFWGETVGGEMLKRLRKICLAHENPGVRDVGAFMLGPDKYL